MKADHEAKQPNSVRTTLNSYEGKRPRQEFINPEKLGTLLATENGPVLLVLIDKNSATFSQRQIMGELLNFSEEKLRIALLDMEYQNTVTEKFEVHGFPAFIFCEQGKKKDVLLGTPDSEVLREFVESNLSDLKAME